MSVATAAPSPASPASRALERMRVAFFRTFFPLLFVAIAAGEWTVVARAAARLGAPPPLVLHLLGPPLFYAFNVWLMRRLRVGASTAAVSVYVAFAFTSIFCAAWVAIAETAWALARLAVIPAVSAGAVPAGAVARW